VPAGPGATAPGDGEEAVTDDGGTQPPDADAGPGPGEAGVGGAPAPAGGRQPSVRGVSRGVPASSMPTACLTRSTMPGAGGGGGGGRGGGSGGGGSTTRSPLHSRNVPQDEQNASWSWLWLPHFLQMITLVAGRW